MILVTGGSGYVGSHIVHQLVDAGKRVRVMVYNRARAESEGRLSELPVEWIEADITKPGTLAEALEGIETIIHTVAIAIEKGNQTYEGINYQGTVNLVNAASEHGIRRFINISQLGASPELPYRFLASKGRAQAYVAQSELDWTAFKPSVIWGPEDEFANTFAKLVPLTPLIFPIVGGEDARFEPVWVGDVATSVVKAIDDPTTISQEHELGGPEILTLEEIERRTLTALNARRWMIPFPMSFLRLIVALMEAILPAPPVTRSLLELLAVSNVTTNNDIVKFVENPRPFTPENTKSYMQDFSVSETLRQFFGR
jgi:NADH dehydrogenase